MDSGDAKQPRSLRRPLPISVRNATLEPTDFTAVTGRNVPSGGGESSSVRSSALGIAPFELPVDSSGDADSASNFRETKKKSLAELLAAKNTSSSPHAVIASPFVVAPSSQRTEGTAPPLTSTPSISSEVPQKIQRSSSDAFLPPQHADPLSKPFRKEPVSQSMKAKAVNDVSVTNSLTTPSFSKKVSFAPKEPEAVSSSSSIVPPHSIASNLDPDFTIATSSTSAPSPSPTLPPPATLSVFPSDLLEQKSSAAKTTAFSFAPRSSPTNGNGFVSGTGSPHSGSPLSPPIGSIFGSGVKGSVRERILKEMIDHVEEPYKIIICDEAGAQILNNSFRMHELMEHDVVVIEDLMVARQPILNSPALYFLNPENAAGVEAMLADWSSRPRYKNLHVFWTSHVSDSVLEQLRRNPLLGYHLKTMVDMMLDFAATETLLFHLDTKMDFTSLLATSFAEAQAGSGNVLEKVGACLTDPTKQNASFFEKQARIVEQHESVLQLLTDRLISFFHTIGDGLPIIRYHSRSPTAKRFAEMLVLGSSKLSGSALSPTAAHRPQLIIVDRCCDLLEALAHHRTYQCLAADLCPFPNGVYEQTYHGRKGEELKRVMMIDEQDEYWSRFRHESFDVCLKFFQEELKKLLEENPSLAHGMQKGIGVSAAGSLVRALPEFLERQSKLSAHMDICTTIAQRYAKQQLQAIVDLELDIIYHRRSTKRLLKEIKIIGGDLSIAASLRIRLLAFSFVFLPEKVFPLSMRTKLITNCGLADDMMPMMQSLEIAQQRVAKFLASAFTKNLSAPADENSDATEEENEEGKKTQNGTSGSSSKKLLHHPIFAKFILEDVLKNTLSPAEFPYVASANYTNEEELSTVRDHFLQKKGKKQTLRYSSIHSVSQQATVGKEEALLQLGYDGTYCLRAPEKIVLFVLGGVTYGEGGVAYELAKDYGREVIIGGCHILNSTDFVKEIRECALLFCPSPARMEVDGVKEDTCSITPTEPSKPPSLENSFAGPSQSEESKA